MREAQVVKHIRFIRQFTFLLTLILLGLQPSLAEPAYWFKWQSKLNGKMLCKQVSPGEGWQQHAGPFYDAQCRNLVKTDRSAINH
jgi:hypothetical protein